MIIASILIGGLTAYYWGVRVGAFVATAVALAFAIAFMKPEYAFKIYLAVGLYGGVVILLAPKLRPSKDIQKLDLPRLTRKALKKWQEISKKNKNR